MNLNNYFHVSYVSGANETGAYVVDSTPSMLPESLGAVSSFYNIEDKNLLTGLSWINMPNEGYWQQIDKNNKPSIEYHQYLIENHEFIFESGAVNVTYGFGTLNDEDIIAKVSGWKDQIRVTRNEYLSLTDFTQLSDSPISSGAKEEYRVFREGLRTMFDNVGPSGIDISWPTMPTGASNINLNPLPDFPPLT